MQRGYFVDWDQLFWRRNWKCWNLSKKAIGWRSFSGGWSQAWSKANGSRHVVLSLFSQGMREQMTSSCRFSAADNYICLHLNAHKSPRRHRGLGRNLLLIIPSGTEILTPNPGSMATWLHSLWEKGLNAEFWLKGFAHRASTKWGTCEPNLPEDLSRISPLSHKSRQGFLLPRTQSLLGSLCFFIFVEFMSLHHWAWFFLFLSLSSVPGEVFWSGEVPKSRYVPRCEWSSSGAHGPVGLSSFFGLPWPWGWGSG